jgi:hypothetical protein
MCGLPGHTYNEPSFVLCKTGCDRGVSVSIMLKVIYDKINGDPLLYTNMRL